MHKNLVSGIAFSREEAIISLSGIPRQIGIEGVILNKVSDENIEIDMIAQNTSAQDMVDFTFTVHRREYPKALKIIEGLANELGAISVKTNAKVAKLSLVGIGMRSHTGVASTMFKTLGETNIPIQMITTSEIKISVIIDEMHIETGVRAIHQAFNLQKPPIHKEQAFLDQ
jgi:aspartate kinase